MRKTSSFSRLSRLFADPRLALALAILIAAATLWWMPVNGAEPAETADRTAWSEPLSETEKIIQLLNRTTFGARPGDVERVRALGMAKFLDRQLRPERVDDSRVDAKIRTLPTLTMTSQDLFEEFPPPRLANPPGMTEEAQRPRKILVELAREEIWRAVYGERQLEEVMVQFWMNHFNIFAPKGADKWLLTSFERDTIRPHALGRFEDLLVATAKSPVMLFYLDNWLSSAPNRSSSFAAKNRRGLNENYARELMELHTLGVDGGYSQQDVTEVARVFTGWTLDRPRLRPDFVFRPRLHDWGDKTVLGHRVRAQGMEEGIEVLRRLAREPATAHFVSWKLCRRFVADEPPPELVERTARTFAATDGDLREVLRTILTSREFYSRAAFRAKVKTPFELVASSLRAFDGDTDGGLPLLWLIARMGQPMFQFQAPTGYPDVAATWVDPSELLFRMKFAGSLAAGRIAGTELHGSSTDPLQTALVLASPEFQRR